MTTRAEYLAAYEAWKRATHEHETRMDAALEGATVDWHFGTRSLNQWMHAVGSQM